MAIEKKDVKGSAALLEPGDDEEVIPAEQEEEVKKPAARKAKKVEEAEETANEISEHEEELEKLESLVDPKRWRIGKPTEKGGKLGDSCEYYVQGPLGFMARNRFFALVGKVMSKAIRETGGSVGGMDDVFGNSGGTINERVGRLSQRDFQDASSFFQLAMELVSYSPDFLLECYILWLDVPQKDRAWCKEVMEQPWNPEQDQWGLKEEEGIEMIERFIDQNYEDIRSFFTETLPKLAQRVSQKEKGRASKSELSKSSKKSGTTAEATN